MIRFIVICCLLGSVASQVAEDCQLDLAIAVDGSGSIEVDNPVKGNWAILIQFLEAVIAGFEVSSDATRVAMVKFDEVATLHFQLDSYDNLEGTLNRTRELDYNRAGGRTNTDGALVMIRDTVFQEANGDRPDVNNLIIIITDGRPTEQLNQNLNNTVASLKDADVRILGVGVTDQVNEDFMRDVIVTDPETDYFPVDDFDELSLTLEVIQEQSCRQINVDCAASSDIYLLIDGSGSIDTENFNLLKAFAERFVRNVNIDSLQSRVGVILFSDNANIQFDLNDFNTLDAVVAAIQAIVYPRGATRTHLAIDLARETGFTSGRGDREGVQDVIVLLTDGNSNNPELTFPAAQRAKADGIHIITVGIGTWINGMELTMLSSYPYDTNYIQVPSFQSLDSALSNRLRDLVCNNVNECSGNPCNGGTCRNMIGMYMCECPSGQAGTNCESQCRLPADVTFAIDSSGSVGRDNFLMEIDFVRQVVMGLNVENDNTRIAAIRYANGAEVQFNLDDYSSKMELLNALSMRYIDGTTNTALAISTMRTQAFNTGNGDRTNIQNVGVVITDGRSNNFDSTWDQARQLRSTGAEIVSVGVGNNLNMRELEVIASAPVETNVVRATAFNTLDDSADDLINAICNNVDDCTPNPCQNSGVCVDLLSGYRCECQSGFSGMNCERGCSKRYDIIFAIDASGSIRNERFPQVLEFIVEIVQDFEVSDSASRFGAISFSDDATQRFQLNTYDTQQDVISAIRNIPFAGGRTNIASALEQIENNMFQAGNGDRDDVDNYIILLTDGESNERETDTVPEAIDARVAGAKIISIGIGTDVNELELRGITSRPYANMMMMAESFTDLTNNAVLREQIKDSVVSASCNSNDECDPNPCQNNAACEDDLYDYRCECQNDFSGKNCERTCTNQMDVALILDFSGSLGQVSDVIIEFARAVVEELPFTQSRARVSVISFSDDATLHFDLDAYSSKREVLNAMSFSRYGGTTNTQAALQMARDRVFVTSGGDRNGVQNIAIVATDGGSNVRSDLVDDRSQNLRDAGVEVHVAAMFNAPDMAEVNEIASNPDNEFVVMVPDASAIPSAAATLVDRLCD